MDKQANNRGTIRQVAPALSLCLLALGVGACTVQKNNLPTRLYHRLTTNYNVHYNAERSFEEAYLGLLETTNESYTHPIAVELVAYQIAKQRGEESQAQGGGAFGKALEKAQKAIKEHSLRVKPERKAGWRKDPKAVAEQAKTEYNGVLHHSWLLLGKSQLYSADVDEAMATFAYMARLYKSEPEIRDRALLWEVRCLSMAGRASEGKQILDLIDISDHRHYRDLKPLYTLTMAEYLLALGKSAEAIEWLSQAVPLVSPKAQRARLYYLLGQLYQQEGNRGKAHEAYARVLKLSPKSELDFAARIRRAELSPRGKTEVIRTLKSMAGRSKYSKQLDQIYYAIGQAHLLSGDTAQAQSAFLFAVDTSQVKAEDYALASLALAGIYMNRMQYLPAREAYREAMPRLSPLEADYALHLRTHRGLDSIAPSAEIQHREDSLLHLASLPEVERNRIIDSVITSLKKREAEEAAARARDSIAELNRDADARMQGGRTPFGPLQPPTQSNGEFYFYNPALLTQGRKEFEKTWGRRPLEDMWRLRRKEGLQTPNADDKTKGNAGQASQGASETSGETPSTLANEDPHQRAYYLAQLPLSDEERAKSLAKVEQAMPQMGRALVDHMDRLGDAARVYTSFLDRFPSSPEGQDVLYRLYLIYLRQGMDAKAEEVRQRYVARYPETTLGKELAQPGYLERLRQKEQRVEQLYQEAYEAYQSGSAEVVDRAYRDLKEHYPTSELLPRLLFLSAMADATAGNVDGLTKKLGDLEQMASPKEIKELSESILSGIKSGRAIYAGRHKPINWSEHWQDGEASSGADSITFVPAQAHDRYAWLLIPEQESSTSQMLYLLANYNFTEHTQRDMSLRWLSALERPALVVSSFATIEMARAYADAFTSSGMASSLGGYSLYPITEDNLSRLSSDEALARYLFFLQGEQDKSLVGLSRKVVAPEILAPETKEADRGEQTQTSPREDGDTSVSIDDIPREAGLHRPTISYEEAQKALHQRQRDERTRAKEREKERNAAQAAKEREKRDREKAKLEVKRAKEKERIKAERLKKQEKKRTE